MTQRTNYYFDEFGVYAGSLSARPEAAAPPDNALWTAPPEGCPAGHAIVARADRSGWAIVPDYRSGGAYDPDGEWRKIERPGELPEGWSSRPPLPEPEPPTPEEIQRQITEAIQRRLDSFAATRGYDGILSAASYATSTNATYQAEGQYCIQARDDTWAAAYLILAEVAGGERPRPTAEEVMAELPELKWPNEDPLRDVKKEVR